MLWPRFCKGSRNAIVSPPVILASHADDQFGDFSSHRRSPRVSPVFGPVELAGDQLSIPTQDGVRFGSTGYRFESLSPSRFPIYARVARCESARGTRAGKCER